MQKLVTWNAGGFSGESIREYRVKDLLEVENENLLEHSSKAPLLGVHAWHANLSLLVNLLICTAGRNCPKGARWVQFYGLTDTVESPISQNRKTSFAQANTSPISLVAVKGADALTADPVVSEDPLCQSVPR
jgi:hypothetical protein